MKVRQHEAQLLDDCAHRAGITDCPECGIRSSNEQWSKAKNIEYVILDPQRHSKHSSCIVISFCPKCAERSWIHEDLDSGSMSWCNGGFTKPVQKKMQKEKVRRVRAAINVMATSPCLSCKHVTDLSFSCLTFQVIRQRGGRKISGRPCEGKCELESK